jgi:dTDP-L-rhamnose 4-epimerase
MKVLVTGGAGFIGSHVVDDLCRAGCQVVVVDSLDPGVHRNAPAYLRSDVEYVFTDLRQLTPGLGLEDCEAVVHLAALGGVARARREPANVIGANALGTAKLVEIASTWAHLKRVVVAGSFSVYGSNYSYRLPSSGSVVHGTRLKADLDAGRFEVYGPDGAEIACIEPITVDAPPAPLELYGASKLMQELAFAGFDNGIVTTLRFSSVYGSRLRVNDGEATIIARLAGWIQSGVSPVLFEDGRQQRDWVFVGDLVELVSSIVLRQVAGSETINVCSGEPTTLTEACNVLNRVFGTDVEPIIQGGYRAGDMRHCLGDAHRFSELLGRAPRRFEDAATEAFGSGGN